jgi:signal transduction histidine kinase
VALLEAAPRHHFAASPLRPLLNIALVLAIVGVATAPLARRISRPVERLTEATRRLGAGELAYRVEIPHQRGWRRRHRHGHRGMSDELTELTRAWNEMAERVERLVRGQKELLANVSHELRSPLARLRVALELLPRDSASAQRLVDIENDINDLDRLIEDVLTVSRLEAGALPLRRDRVPLAPLLDQLAARARLDPLTAGKEVRVAEGAPAFASADGALLKHALWNLVENAAKYGAPPITLAAAARDDHLLLTVTDEGAGIPAADRERIFDPFFRGDVAHTPAQNAGVGLGLALAKRVAEAHGGTIRAEANGDARGCRLVIDIPLST